MSRSSKLTILVFSMLAAMLSSDLLAQPGGRGRGGRGGGPPWGGRGGGSEFELLMRDDIRNEIELVDDQVDDLRALGDEFRSEMRSVFEDARESGDWGSIRDKMSEMRKEMEEQAHEILLPHQVERLQQLTGYLRSHCTGSGDDLEQGLWLCGCRAKSSGKYFNHLQYLFDFQIIHCHCHYAVKGCW